MASRYSRDVGLQNSPWRHNRSLRLLQGVSMRIQVECDVVEDIQRPPMTNEMKNQVRVRNSCQQWRMVMTAKTRQAMIAAALEGMYS